jgi:hypothetical protein
VSSSPARRPAGSLGKRLGAHGVAYPMPQARPPPPQYAESSESSSETIDVKYIITEKPKVKVLREFMRDILADVRGEDELLFG